MYVFISYRSTQKDIALKVAQSLHSNNIPIWMDILGGLVVGTDWTLSLQEALKNAAAVLVCLSPDYAKSQNCRNELQRAIKLGKPIFPIVIEPIEDNESPLEIETIQYINFVKLPYERAIHALISELKEELSAQYIDHMFLNEIEFSDDSTETEALTIHYDPDDPNEIETQDTPKISTGSNKALQDEASDVIESESAAKPQTNPPREPPQTGVQVAAVDTGIEWASIHSGGVRLVATKRTYDYVYQKPASDEYVGAIKMSKHPITNAQFRKFYEDDGYLRDQYWTERGLELKALHGWTKPKIWEKESLLHFAKEDHPIVGISWYEALAYTNWLSEKLDQHISLPTDAEWQRAAQFTDNRKYPWGNVWVKSHCNHSLEGSSKGTTPVHQYRYGRNSYDIYDLIGNVFEWCLTEFTTGVYPDGISDPKCVIRGGAWSTTDAEAFTTTARDYCPAEKRNTAVGFRIVALESEYKQRRMSQ